MTLFISAAEQSDLVDILALERRIEGDNAASLDTLQKRQAMFAPGFKIARVKDKIVGYIQTCQWVRPEFETFQHIRNFPDRHTEAGNELYVIFLGVDADYRKRGIATQLVESAKDMARIRTLDAVSLVAKNELIGMYEKMGFAQQRNMPDFLPNSAHQFMVCML